MLWMMRPVFRATAARSLSPFTSSGTNMDRHGDSTACVHVDIGITTVRPAVRGRWLVGEGPLGIDLPGVRFEHSKCRAFIMRLNSTNFAASPSEEVARPHVPSVLPTAERQHEVAEAMACRHPATSSSDTDLTSGSTLPLIWPRACLDERDSTQLVDGLRRLSGPQHGADQRRHKRLHVAVAHNAARIRHRLDRGVLQRRQDASI